MAATQAGDKRAYDALLRQVTPLLRGIARRRIADRAEAEDAVQDTLLTIHRLRAAYDPERPLRPWLAALCERRCADRLRLRWRQSRRDLAFAESAVQAMPDDPEHAAIERLATADVRRAVALLPPAQRRAIALAKLQGLPLAEAAARSGTTVGSLKAATHRALRALRAELAPDALVAVEAAS